MDFVTSDRTIQVGDYVLSAYQKGEILYQVTEIERRFLTKDDLRYGVYSNGKVGDEYNPIANIIAVANLGIKEPSNKKFRKLAHELDASYLIKVSPEYIKNHIDKLKEILNTLFP